MRPHRWVPLAALAFTLALSHPAAAQDVHYWASTYGTSSTLLSGAVIGSVTDLSATYYNPGALALFQNPALLLGAKAWDFSNITVENGAGEGLDLKTSVSGPAPDIVAGLFPFHILDHDQLAYSFLTRHGSDLRIQTRTSATADVTPVSPGPERFAGEVTLDQNLFESWTGATWSVLAAKHVGLGVTQYVAFRSQRARLEKLAQAYGTDGQVASATEFKEYDFTDYRVVTKAGLGVIAGSLTLGLNVTSPGLHLLGSGTVAVDTALTGFDLDHDGTADPVLSADQQRDVDASYHSPLSIGFGAGYRTGKTTFHASAEWFDGVDRYRVLETDPFIGQSSGAPAESQILDEAKSVFDYGAGVTQKFREHFSGYAGFSVDRSPRVSGTQLSIGAWDNYHVSSGVEFRFGRTDLLVGLVYSTGKQSVRQVADIGSGGGGSTGPGPESDAEVRFNSTRVVFGFSYNPGPAPTGAPGGD